MNMTEEKKEKPNGRKWDGKSRVSTNEYKKNYNDIFKTHCAVCGSLTKADEWSQRVGNCCIDCG
tara:strand:- start:1059 stop:1250 length:192 start_codon:yes stop_codon:yes gene_type:complete